MSSEFKTSLFINVDTIPFTGYWDGKPRTFKPGQEKWMPDFLARHFAKHLANKLLLDLGHENATSPKKPEQVPLFMEQFNRCYKPGEDDLESELDVEIDLANKNRGISMDISSPKKKNSGPTPDVGPGNEDQIISQGSDDDEDFEGLKEPAA